MLTHIDIKNLATIKAAQIEFKPNTTAITGETGTGKSILIEAIGLALGARAAGQIVRKNIDRADITLTFDLRKQPSATQWLKTNEVDQSDESCIIRRILTPDGRSRSYVNGTPLPLAKLRELAEKLIHIHSQNAELALRDTRAQLTLLDNFANSLKLAESVNACALAYQTMQTEINALEIQINKENSEAELLSFQLNELEALQLDPNEFATLDKAQRKLAQAGTSLTELHTAIEALECNSQGILPKLKKLTQITTSLNPIYPEALQWQKTLEEIIIQLNDLNDSLRHTTNSTTHDPEKLAKVESRLGALFDLGRKHKIPPEELYNYKQQLNSRLKKQQHGDIYLKTLSINAENIKQQYSKKANELSLQRTEAAKKLELKISKLLQELSLKHAKFAIIFEPKVDTINRHGLEKIVFHIKTNPDQPMLPLANVASGGELARISLALHIACAETPTLIFDEVDSGVGGGTAETIGKLLWQLGCTKQVFCVTHTPQVAAQTNNHICVTKLIDNGSTQIDIKTLNKQEHINEIARMLGGIKITEKTLAHAEEMTEKSKELETI